MIDELLLFFFIVGLNDHACHFLIFFVFYGCHPIIVINGFCYLFPENCVDFSLQICSMVRDMNVEVRVEAFTALGKIAYISGDILLQTMSKRVLGTIKEKQSLAWCSSHMHKIHASVAAGLFVHGLEDEYSEVKQNSD